ncbi:MAG: hypothetical protein ACT4O0_01865 [Pseudonocardia sp.]
MRERCGVAVVADSLGRKGHGIVADALVALTNLAHRGVWPGSACAPRRPAP